MATGQSPYGLARLLYEFPDVFDAYAILAIERTGGTAKKETFAERRERTREARIAKLGRR